MTEIMRPPTEEETAMMMSLMEEMMQMPSEEQMAEMEQGNLIIQFISFSSHFTNCRLDGDDVKHGHGSSSDGARWVFCYDSNKYRIKVKMQYQMFPTNSIELIKT